MPPLVNEIAASDAARSLIPCSALTVGPVGGGNLLGIVLNNINMASDENYYYYSGYYYDYYSKQDDEPAPKGKKDSKKPAHDEAKVEIKPKY